MTKRKADKILNLLITKFSKKGHGLGYHEREQAAPLPIEVPFTLPGDHVQVNVKQKRGGTAQSQLLEILHPSPDRITPRCVHFASCGGCRWQQMSYDDQLTIKQKKVAEAFGALITNEVTLHPILSCDPPWQYRNKMEFTFSQDASKQKFLGLIINGSKGKVLSLTECHLVADWFIHALTAVRQWWESTELTAYHPYTNQGALRNLTMREGVRSGDRMLVLLVSGNPDYALTKAELNAFVAAVREAVEPEEGKGHLSLFLRIQQQAKGKETQYYEILLYGPDHIRETLHVASKSLEFSISPTAFFQPNTKQAERLYSQALQMAQIPENAVVYDLYCGTGTLGICVAERAKEVIGIELSPESSLDARTNAKKNELSNVTILTGDVGQLLANKNLPLPDVILVDPPRMGLDNTALTHIIELQAPTLVYVSCNPETQAANIQTLVENGYLLTALQPVDQFPHTIHIENIAILKGRGR